MSTNAFNSYEQLIFSVFNVPVQLVATTLWNGWCDGANEREEDEGQRYHLDCVAHDLRYAYLLQPRPPTRHRYSPSQLLFWEPASSPNRTVMMTNATCGNSHAVFRLSEEVSWECIYVQISDRDGRPDNYMFNYYRDHRRIARSLGVGQEEDGRWLFCADGPIQAFEDPSYYKRRRIVDRLNREIVTEYLYRLEYDIRSDDFWTTTSKAWLLWDDWFGKRSAPGRDGVDEEGTRTGWKP